MNETNRNVLRRKVQQEKLETAALTRISYNKGAATRRKTRKKATSVENKGQSRTKGVVRFKAAALRSTEKKKGMTKGTRCRRPSRNEGAKIANNPTGRKKKRLVAPWRILLRVV